MGTKHDQLNPRFAEKIELKPVTWLKPYDRNARTHSPEQLDQIAASIAEFGFVNPILTRSDGTIIAGHGRLEASTTRLGMKEVPVIILDHLSEAQARLLVLADNKIAMNAGWDEALLSQELAALEADGLDLNITGFSEEELEGLLDGFEEGDGEEGDGEGEIQEPPKNPVTKPGDVWVLGNHRLVCGDATKSEYYNLLMKDEKADLIFTDPPYGVDYEGITNDDRPGLKKLLEGAFENIAKFGKKGAGVYCFHSDKCADIFHETFRKIFHFSSMIIWVKPALVLSQSDYHSRHEPCLYGWLKGASHKWFGDRAQTSVWEFGKESVEGHTTPKPVALICNALENSTARKAVVLDPFGGSGSTIMACEKSGRAGRSIELEPGYCDVIVQRWESITKKSAVLEKTGKTFSETAAAKKGKPKRESPKNNGVRSGKSSV